MVAKRPRSVRVNGNRLSKFSHSSFARRHHLRNGAGIYFVTPANDTFCRKRGGCNRITTCLFFVIPLKTLLSYLTHFTISMLGFLS